MKRLILFCGIILGIASCSKENPGCSAPDYFVFGDAFGMCGGNCPNLYLLKQHKIYADNIENFYLEPLAFSSVPLTNTSYQLAQSLPDELPAWLNNHPDTTLGCPDCYDQGLIYIEISRNGVVSKW